MAFERPITAWEAVENIHAKKYLLPSIQRGIVWHVDQITKLFDSIPKKLGEISAVWVPLYKTPFHKKDPI